MSDLKPQLLLSLRNYSKEAFVKDLVAGVIVAIIALPLSIALALASGVSPEQGLYTAIVAGFLISALGGSKVQIAGPTAAFATIVAGIVARNGMDGLAVATILAGILLIIMGLLRMGSMIKYIPYTITTGFTAGIAVTILIGQIKDFLGLTFQTAPVETMEKLEQVVLCIGTMNATALGVGCLALAILIFWPKTLKKIPASLVAVIVTAGVVKGFDLPVNTIGDLYTISGSLPHFQLPALSYETVAAVLPDAFTIAILAAIESLLSAVVADEMIGARHNSNMELVSQGVGNVVSVFFGGFAATGAIARTATNIRAGAVSSVSAIVHSLFLVAVAMWLLPLIEFIPLAALAAVLVMVAYDMSDLRTVRHIFEGPKSDWSVMILTFALTVVFDLTVAVYTGVMLASLLFMRRMSELTGIHTCVSGEEEEAAEHDIPVPDEESVPDGVEIFAINGPLFFGVADRFQSTLDAMETPPKVFIMYLHNTPAIDMTGIHALEAFLERRQEGCRVLFAAVQEPARKTLQRVGILRAVGEENIFPSLDEALLRAEEILEEEKRK